MDVIVVANQKGGVAKTTTAVNLAAGLALVEYHARPKQPSRVLLIDMDPQGNASSIVSTGLFSDGPAAAPSYTLANLLLDDNPPPAVDLLLNARVPTSIPRSNLDYLPINRAAMAAAAQSLVSTEAGEFRLAEVIPQLEKLYRYIVIDTRPAYDLLLLNALVAANALIIPVEITGMGMASLPDMFATVQRVQKRLNRNLNLLGILPSKCNMHRSEAQMVYEAMHNEYGDLLFEPIKERADISVANTEGLDIFSFRPPRSQQEGFVSSSSSVQEFAAFVNEVIRRLKTK
jgi:chromosome partitioning protein